MQSIRWCYYIVLCMIFCGALVEAQPSRGGASGTRCGSSIDCSSRSISDDCGNGCSLNECSGGIPITTFFLPRPILTDLTYRNNSGFYQRYHDSCCSFFTYDATYLYQKNRHAACIGASYFGKDVITIAQEKGDIESLNLSLGSLQPGGFLSTFTFRPKRSVFGWMPQLTFNLDCFCTGLWTDITIAVLNVRHEVCLNEKVVTPGEISGIVNAQQAFDMLRVFPAKRDYTGVDDIEVRLGYDWLYCDNDHIGGYITGIIPTGKEFDNSRWFQPLVGSRSGAFGIGFSGDCTLWDDEIALTSFTVMSELKYLYRFKHKDRRMFDLKNGPLSRFLLVATDSERFKPFSGTEVLRHCVRVQSRSLLEWWLSFHYQWCNWGFEAAYNLFYRDGERIQPQSFCFGDVGIFDMTRCNNLTSHSTAVITDQFGEGTPNAEFVPLSTKNVNFSSARARKALSNTLSATISYNNLWRDCYPWSVAISASYEFVGESHRFSTLENWGVFGKWTFSI